MLDPDGDSERRLIRVTLSPSHPNDTKNTDVASTLRKLALAGAF